MNINISIRRIINSFIFFYSKEVDGNITLDLENIPDFEIDSLCSLLLSENKYSASEALGPDNDNFYTDMLPSLLSCMENSNRESSINFITTWKRSIRSYFKSRIEKLIENSIQEYSYHSSSKSIYESISMR